MICFCDIPLSQIKEHVYYYGRYGIGMKREWIINNNFNPVSYTSDSSIYHRSIQDTLDVIRKINRKNKNYDLALKVVLSLIEIVRYNKPIEGKMRSKVDDNIVNKKFYDEREWRYVPTYDKFPLPFLKKNQEIQKKNVLNLH